LLYYLGGFEAGHNYRIADLACGNGLVGLELEKRIQANGSNVQSTFIDLTPEGLAKIPKTQNREIKIGDVRRTNSQTSEFTHTFCRYAIKNMPEHEQRKALREIARITEKGGLFVLQDMVSPEGLKEFQNAERMAKQRTTTPKVTPMNVPTEAEWIRLLNEAGFVVEDIQHTVSNVDTKNWVAEGQMTQKALDQYFRFLKEAKQRWSHSWGEYKIIEEPGGNFKITYPVVLFKCRKK